MAETEELGIELFVQGFAKFLSTMKLADKALHGVEKSVDGAGGSLKVLAKGMTKALAGFKKLSKFALKAAAAVAKIAFKTVATGAGLAAAAVGGLALTIGKLAMDAAPLVGIGDSFEVLSEKFGVSLEAMKQAAGGTITSFELMRQANVALTGAGEDFGKEFGQALPSLLEAARAAAKATGQDVDFLFQSLVTGIKRSSPLIIDNTGLVLSLGEANEALAQELGKSVDELTEEEKQIALLRATVEASEGMVENFGGSQASAAEQIASFKTQIQETKDQIGIAFLPALQALMTPLSEIATNYGPLLIDWAQRAGETLGTVLPMAIQAITMLLDGNFNGAIQRAATIIGNVFGPEGQQVFNDWRLKIEEIALGISETLAPLKEAVMDVFNTLSNWWVLHGDDIRESASEMFTTFAEVGQNLVDNIIPFIVEQLEKFSEWVEVNGPLISDFLQQSHDTWSALATAVGDFWAVVEQILDGLITQILNIGTFIMQLATGDWPGSFDTMDKIVDDAISSIQDIWKAFADWVTGWFNTDWATVVQTWTNNWENMKNIVELVIDNVIGWFVNLGLEVVNTLSDISNFIMNQFKAAADWLEDKMEKLKRVFQNVRDVIDGLRERIKKLKKDILELVLPGWLNPGSPAPLEIALIGISRAVDLTTDSFEKLQLALQQIDIASKFSAAGGFFGRLFEERRIKPLKDEIDAQQEVVDLVTERWAAAAHGSIEQGKLNMERFAEQQKLNSLLDQRAKREAKLAELQKQQADVAFLKQQLQLLELIKEQGLDAGSILGGVKLGLEASAADLTTAMSEAMKQIVVKMQQDLGLSSPANALQSSSNVTNNITTQSSYNLTTQSVNRPGTLAMEFSAMEIAAAATR